MTNGEPVRVRVAMKPISTVPRALRTVDVATGEAAPAIHQRSDVARARRGRGGRGDGGAGAGRRGAGEVRRRLAGRDPPQRAVLPRRARPDPPPNAKGARPGPDRRQLAVGLRPRRPRLAPSWKSAAAELVGPGIGARRGGVPDAESPNAGAHPAPAVVLRHERGAVKRNGVPVPALPGSTKLRLDVALRRPAGEGFAGTGRRSIGIQPMTGPAPLSRRGTDRPVPRPLSWSTPPSVRDGGAAGRHRLPSAIAAHAI